MIRPYQKTDKPALLALLQLNIPEYFDPSELADYKEYLDQHKEDYFVVETAGKLVGAGGINYFYEQKQARISWDFVHPEAHGQGWGKKLVQHRIEHIKAKGTIKEVIVRTSQLAYLFYQKQGFELGEIKKDFWATGFDLYEMRKQL